MRTVLTCLLLALLPGLAAAQTTPATPSAPPAQPVTPAALQYPEFQVREHKEDAGALAYRLLVPKDYRPAEAYPLVIWLHGSGEKGRDNKAQLYPRVAETFLAAPARAKYPCFVMVPQCPPNSSWLNVGFNKPPDLAEPSRMILSTVAELQKEFNIDARRIYIGGFSMGACGTWNLITRYPDLFAAAFPIAGNLLRGDRMVSFTKDIPIWVFQGDKDAYTSVDETRGVVAAFKAAGGNVKYTEYAGGTHDYTRALREPGLLDWLFSCRHRTPGTFTPAVIPDDAWTFIKTIPPGTHGTWTGKVKRTLHGAVQVNVDGVRYRLQPTKQANAQVAATLGKIVKGELTGEFQVTGTVQVDDYVWIIVEDIQAK